MLVKVKEKLRLYKPKPYLWQKSQVPGEYVGDYWLLKRDDPYVWFGTADGHVVTGWIMKGAEFDEEGFRQPKKKRYVKSMIASPYTKTSERILTRHGAMASQGKQYEMTAYYHPADTERYVVAGWNPVAKTWVIE
jgi:hypothetical protein